MENYTVSISADTLARFKKMNSEVTEYLSFENGTMTIESANLDQLGLPYLYSEPMEEAKSKEIVRVICDNNLQLNDTYIFFKRLIKSAGGLGAHFPSYSSEDGYAKVSTNTTWMEFVLKNYKVNDYYPADRIISLVPDPYYNFYELRDKNLNNSINEKE